MDRSSPRPEGGYQNYDQGYDDADTGGSYGDDGCY